MSHVIFPLGHFLLLDVEGCVPGRLSRQAVQWPTNLPPRRRCREPICFGNITQHQLGIFCAPPELPTRFFCSPLHRLFQHMTSLMMMMVNPIKMNSDLDRILTVDFPGVFRLNRVFMHCTLRFEHRASPPLIRAFPPSRIFLSSE